jgi:hypothetical protein
MIDQLGVKKSEGLVEKMIGELKANVDVDLLKMALKQRGMSHLEKCLA